MTKPTKKPMLFINNGSICNVFHRRQLKDITNPELLRFCDQLKITYPIKGSDAVHLWSVGADPKLTDVDRQFVSFARVPTHIFEVTTDTFHVSCFRVFDSLETARNALVLDIITSNNHELGEIIKSIRAREIDDIKDANEQKATNVDHRGDLYDSV